MNKRANLRTDKSNLYEDVTLNILSRLPVKTLSRFKCVSKQWNFLLSSPNFVKLHLSRASQNSSDVMLCAFGYGGAISVCSLENGRVSNQKLVPSYLPSVGIQCAPLWTPL